MTHVHAQGIATWKSSDGNALPVRDCDTVERSGIRYLGTYPTPKDYRRFFIDALHSSGELVNMGKSDEVHFTNLT